MWLGDDFHHNGAFRLSYGFEYAAMMESGKDVQQFEFDAYDTFGWYLKLGPLGNVNAKYLHGKIPTWNDFVAHPDYDEFWKRQTMIPQITIGEGADAQRRRMVGPGRFLRTDPIYDALEKHDTRAPQLSGRRPVAARRVGGWPGDRLGAIPFDSATGKYFREEIQAPWFAHFLKDKGPLDLPEALTFEAGIEPLAPLGRVAAEAQHRGAADLPRRRQGARRSLRRRPDRRCLRQLRVGPGLPGSVSPASDPADLLPGGSKWSTWLVEDQRFVEDRADVLSWKTPPLDAEPDDRRRDRGAPVRVDDRERRRLDREARSTSIPSIIPENWDLAGYQLMVSNEVFRGRYRQSGEKPEPITPDQVLEYAFSLHTQNYTFLKGSPA